MEDPYPDEPRGGAPPLTAPPTSPNGGRSRDASNVSAGKLVTDVTNDISTLFRQEIALAKAELKEEAVKAGKGAGMFGGAAGAGYFALIFLLLAAMFGLGEVMALGWAALIVAGVLLIAAAVLALRGRSTVQSVHPAPTQTVETLKEDVQWARNRKS
jgi:putative superfamily III holin-X